jgi:hypothetical protein
MDLINSWKMEHIKIIKGRQAETAQAYKNTKQKMPKKMKADICFNKMCGSNSVPLESVFKYIIKSVVQVVGYLHIMDLSNARKMEQIK